MKIKKRKKFFSMIMMVITVIGVVNISEGKYVKETNNIVANIFIDRNPPQIQCISIKNNNSEYENFANHTHTITVQIKVNEKNIKENYLESEKTTLLLDDNEINSAQIEIVKLKEEKENIVYEIKIKEIQGDGNLKLKIRKGIIVDISGNMNAEQIINTKIQIDNTPPVVNFYEEASKDGKMIAKIESNETIRKRDGWEMTEQQNGMQKEFANKITYVIPIIDLAQNETKTKIDITNATNIIFEYGGCGMGGIGWSFGYGNGQIAGKEYVEQKRIEKIEETVFRTSGEIEDDFIQVRSYVHTYWGEGAIGLGMDFENMYKHGYNPSEDSFDSMKNGGKLSLKGKTWYVLGGYGMNWPNAKALSGTERLPPELAKQYLYGISALCFKLKEESYYSIIYQVLVNGYGWQKVASDGEEATYAHDKPISAFRVVLAPKTEKQDIVNEWSEVIGTFQVE